MSAELHQHHPNTIVPARFALNADGTPFSAAYGDVYHSSSGGPGQAAHVFLAGNELPQRWQGRNHFVIVETGFGLGLNFLATWSAWRKDARRCARLHFVSCELHPFRADDLARAYQRWPEFTPLAAELVAQWPELTPGLHRLHLDDGRVTLTLALGDANELLGQLVLQADAFYLDGFSPARNPQMWSARVCHLLARLAALGATLATWSVAGEVREKLRRAGFSTAKADGFGGKRQMLRGLFLDLRPRSDGSGSAAAPASGEALVIGAGLAGCAIVERLAARGWTTTLLEAAAAPAQGASGNLAGVLRPLPNIDDNRMSRLSRAGALYGWRHIAGLRARGFTLRAEACGVLHLARDAAQEARMRAVVQRLALPPSFLCQVDAAEASALAGWPLAAGGWYFAGSGWVQAPSLCAANLAAAGERLRSRFGTTAARLERGGGQWHALNAQGERIASAPVLVLAAGINSRAFAEATAAPLVSARGQVSLLPALPDSPPRRVLCRDGYVSPEVDGLRCVGASFDVEDEDSGLRLHDHRANLDKLEAMLPGYGAGLDPAAFDGRVGFRPATPDRLPFVGALPLDARSEPLPATLAGIERAPGLYLFSGFGARGLVWSSLCAELLASMLSGEPLPLERDLCEALDPARFLLRADRRNFV